MEIIKTFKYIVYRDVTLNFTNNFGLNDYYFYSFGKHPLGVDNIKAIIEWEIGKIIEISHHANGFFYNDIVNKNKFLFGLLDENRFLKYLEPLGLYRDRKINELLND